MRDDLVRYFESHHKLLESGALSLLLSAPEPLVVSRRLLEIAGADSPFVTREMVETALNGAAVTAVADVSRSGGRASGAPARRDPATPGFRVLVEGFSEAPPGRAPLEAYGDLFRSRFVALSRMIRGRPDLPDVRPVSDSRQREGEGSVIGMVREVRVTSEKRHTILTVEDESGSMDALIPRDAPEARESLLPDEVVGLTLRFPRDAGRLPRVVRIHRPELPGSPPYRRSPDRHRVLFLSDLHVGSRSFLRDSWNELVGFLQGEGPDGARAREVGDVVVAGDLVDGIGIYPNQERDLAISDVFEQYTELGRRLGELPARLNIILIPGNHDAVCPAEPQPGLPPEIRSRLPANVRTLGNPATFLIDGVVIEAYHGRSFDDLIPAIRGASYARPTDVMKQMLAMRHLAPIYGGRTPLAPLVRDGLVIDPAPDILVTGHVHTYGVDRYRGVLLINASTWQAETEYQRMRNISPVPARAAVVQLADLSVDTLDFSKPSSPALAAS